MLHPALAAPVVRDEDWGPPIAHGGIAAGLARRADAGVAPHLPFSRAPHQGTVILAAALFRAMIPHTAPVPLPSGAFLDAAGGYRGFPLSR